MCAKVCQALAHTTVASFGGGGGGSRNGQKRPKTGPKRPPAPPYRTRVAPLRLPPAWWTAGHTKRVCTDEAIMASGTQWLDWSAGMRVPPRGRTAFDEPSPCAAWPLPRETGCPLCPKGSPCARTIGSYPTTSLRHCTVCGVIRSPTLEGRAAAPLRILGGRGVRAWVWVLDFMRAQIGHSAHAIRCRAVTDCL